MMRSFVPPFALVLVLAACGTPDPAPEQTPDSAVELASNGEEFDRLVPVATRGEVLGTGFSWGEGPVWIDAIGTLLFTDVPSNRIHAWSQDAGVTLWLEPSGYSGDDPNRPNSGANGLLLDAEGRLVAAHHGDRRMARYDGDLAAPGDPTAWTTIADRVDGMRLSSPNDAAYAIDGSLWFTDPPYGLPGADASDEKEVPFNGVFRLHPDGTVTVVTDSLTRPNGVAFSPDGRTAYVANSDPRAAWWIAVDVADDGTPGAGRLLFDATPLVGPENPGLPDGLKVDREGYVFATGPGGVLVLSPAGDHLGTIRTADATANIAFGADDRTLFLTSSGTLIRVRR